jgi:DNA-binding LacI/PurR family transcriptional regulator
MQITFKNMKKQKSKGIILTPDQKETLIKEIKMFGETRIRGVVTLKRKSQKVYKRIRLDGNNAGFKITDELIDQDFIKSKVTEHLKRKVNAQ